MDLWVQCLVCKHENVSSDPQNPHKVRYGSIHLLLQENGRQRRELAALRSVNLVYSTEMTGDGVSNKVEPEDRPPRLSSDRHMCAKACVCLYTSMQKEKMVMLLILT